MGRLAFFLLVAAFAAASFTVMRSIYLASLILRLVRDIDPGRAAELSGANIPVLGKLMWMDPVRFFIFVHSSSQKDERLEARVSQYRRNELTMLVCWTILMLSLFVLRRGLISGS